LNETYVGTLVTEVPKNLSQDSNYIGLRKSQTYIWQYSCKTSVDCWVLLKSVTEIKFT